MSILPAFKAVLDDNLTAKQSNDVLKKIKDMKGVLSAAFSGAASKSINVTYRTGNDVQENVSKLTGVKEIKRLL
jgi:hypothetical protein